MPFSKPLKYLVFAVVAMAALTVGFFAFVNYSLRHMQFDLSGLELLIKRTTATVEIATLTVPRCGASAEFLPAGDRRREATMLYVATIIDLYRTTFGKMPERIDDLDKLPSFYNADKLNGSEVKKSCSLHVHPSGSYVLSCGAPLPPAKEVDVLFRRTEPAQRFYMVTGTETLYVPVIACH